MTVELDHVFIRATVGAPEAAELVEFGLSEGTPNRHPGQGTACRRFFFRNAMLELLWVEDSSEAQGALARPLMLWERCSAGTGGASPFGVCVRPADPVVAEAPFSTWEYRPTYQPDSLAILIASGSPVEEPLWFYMGFGRRPDRAPVLQRQPVAHAVGFREVTGLRLTSPVAMWSDAMAAMVREQVISIQRGTEHLLEITFDGGVHGRSRDFRPRLPLIFRW